MARTPAGFAEIIGVAIEQAKKGIFVSMPGKVEKYDAAAQTVDVQPQFLRAVPQDDPDEPFVYEKLPIVPSVPLGWPSALGGTLSITMPMAKGDPVTLIFCDFDPGQFIEKNEPSTPGDLRSHGLANAWAYPGGIRPNAGKVPAGAVDTTHSVLGGKVKLGAASAAQALLEGTLYRTDEDTMLSGLSTAFGTLITASTGPLAPLAAGFTAAKAAVDVFITAAGVAGGYLSTKHFLDS